MSLLNSLTDVFAPERGLFLSDKVIDIVSELKSTEIDDVTGLEVRHKPALVESDGCPILAVRRDVDRDGSIQAAGRCRLDWR